MLILCYILILIGSGIAKPVRIPRNLEEVAAEIGIDLDLLDNIPGVGHIKGVIHYIEGNNEAGDASMKKASRTAGVVMGGVMGFAACGPGCGAAGGIAGGAVIDGLTTVVDVAVAGKTDFQGYTKAATYLVDVLENDRKITKAEAENTMRLVVDDALAGYTVGKKSMTTGQFRPNYKLLSTHGGDPALADGGGNLKDDDKVYKALQISKDKIVWLIKIK